MSDRNTKGKTNLLDTVPVRCERVITRWKGECIVLAFPRFKHTWMCRLLGGKVLSEEIQVELEEHGTAVWQLIDGQRTVREIVLLLDEHFQGEAGYASRITTYLLQMQRDGLIKLRVKN